MGTDTTERHRRSRPWRPHGLAVQYAVPAVQEIGAEELRELAAGAQGWLPVEIEQDADGRWIGEVRRRRLRHAVVRPGEGAARPGNVPLPA